MFFRLFLLFSIVPAIELAVLIYAGSRIGVYNTLAIVILTAVAGSLLVRHEGLMVMYRFRANLADGVFPSEEILDGAMILVAGALLLTPGFFTDALGLMLVIPASRHVIKAYVRRFIEKRITMLPPDRPWP